MKDFRHEGLVGEEAGSGLRLDRYIAEKLCLLSRSQLKARLLKAQVNGKTVKLSRIVIPGDHIDIFWRDVEETDLIPEDIPLSVLYEDDRVIVIDKPQGLVVHPGAGNHSGTLANALVHRCLQRGISTQGFRPGIVHRLDKDTSGVLIAAYDDEPLAFLADQFKARTVKKTYLALLHGAPKKEFGSVETFIARDPQDRKRFTCTENRGKFAHTLYKVLRHYDDYTLVKLLLRTGRTHQLRVHMRYLGCPILGDPIYGYHNRKYPHATLMLHARKLKISLYPSLAPETFIAPLPERFKPFLSLQGEGER